MGARRILAVAAFFLPTATSGATHVVEAGSDWAAVISGASGGDTIEVR